MIFREIALDIADEQIRNLKELNSKIVKFLEDRFSLKIKIIDELRQELTKVIEEQKELIEILEKVNKSGDYYDVLLTHADNEILNLPWRMAEDPVSGKSLGSIQQLLLSKCPADYFRKAGDESEPLAPPLKILIMISSPEDSDYKSRLSYEKEEFMILKSVLPLMQSGLVQIDFTDDGSLDALKRKIKRNRYHILHFSGHAIYKDNTGYMILENPLDLKTEKVKAADFADALNCNPDYKIPVVLLSACQTAKGSSKEGLTGISNHLVKIGIPTVISMGLSVQDKYAAYFSARFYNEIALKENLVNAFNAAVEKMREFEFAELSKASISNPLPLQWIIPNLYRSEKILHPVKWETDNEKLNYTSSRFNFENDPLLIEHEKDYFFIGRRKEKAEIMPRLERDKTIFLRGQGGVGKTAMAEHLVQRLIAYNPETKPFLFNEKIKSLPEFQKKIEYFLEDRGKLDRAELALYEKGIRQFIYLLNKLSEVCTPVFIFDNLESFQAAPDKTFSDEYQDIMELIEHLIKLKKYYVILTGRYKIPGFENIWDCSLNQTGINDFWKKCTYLELSDITEYAIREKKDKKEQTPAGNKTLEFFDIVKLLHETFGGNFRALELFDKLVRKEPDKIKTALADMEDFREKYKNETEEVKTEMGSGLIFKNLYSMLNQAQKNILLLLSRFRTPAQKFAFELQKTGQNEEELAGIFISLNDLTLLEISLDKNTETVYYYCTPIVKDLLTPAQSDQESISFSSHKAGLYYQYNYYNLNHNLTDMEEAFYHYYEAASIEKVNETGDFLSDIFYNYSLYQNSFYYAFNTFSLSKDKTRNKILNMIGLIFHLFGKLEESLSFLKKAYIGYKEIGDKSGEGATLNNISQIFIARGDYETALDYLKESLRILKEIGDKSGEGKTLNNISQIYSARGDYETALDYLKKSLRILKEIGDKSGEGKTLNNIGQIYSARGDYETALDYLKESLRILKEIGDKSGEGTTLNNISQIFIARGDYETALDYLKESLRILKEIGDKSGEGKTLNNISQIFKARGDYETALDYLKESLRILKEIGDKSGEGKTLNNISQIFKARGDYETALDYLKESLRIRQEIGDKSGEGTTLNNISQIYSARGDYETALDYLKESLRISQEIGDKSGEGTTLNNISQIYDARGDYETALDYLNQSLTICQEIGDKSGMIPTLFNMANIAFENKDYQKDMEYTAEAYKLAHETNDAMGLFHVGQRYGLILFAIKKKEEALRVLQRSYDTGKQAGFPDADNILQIIEKIKKQI